MGSSHSHSDCVDYLQNLSMHPPHVRAHFMELYQKNGGDCGYLQELGLMDFLSSQGVTQASVDAPVVVTTNTETTHNHTENHFVEEAPVVNTVTNAHTESHSESTSVQDSGVPQNCIVDMSGTVNTGTQIFNSKKACQQLIVLL